MRLERIAVKTAGATILAAVFLLFSISFAHADVIVTQSVADSATEYRGLSGGGGGIFWQQFGTGYSGTITGMALRVEGGTPTGSFSVYLAACNSSGRPFQSPCNATTTDVQLITMTASSSVTYSVTFATPITISSGQYLTATIYNAGSPALVRIPGSVANTITGGECLFYSFGTDTSCQNIDDMYMTITGYGTGNNNTGITSVISPVNITDADGYVNFNYSYFSGVPSATQANFIINDLTQSQSITGIASTPSAGNNTYSKSVQLSTNHHYSWQPYLVTSLGNIYGPIYLFNTGSQAAPTASTSTILGLFNTFVNGAGTGSILDNAFNNGNFNAPENASTSTASGIISFSNIPSYFAQRVPFGYLYDIYNDWNHVSTSSAEFGTLSINFSSLGISTSTKTWLPESIIFFSTTTVTEYLGGGLLDTLNILAGAAIAITWAMALFRKTTNVIKPV